MGKWSLIFGALGILTYWRRFDFLDISNRIGVRMRAVAFQKILESNFYRHNTQFQTYVHHNINDIRAVSEFTGQTAFLALRGVFFLLGGTISLLYHASPYICLIAALIMSSFNRNFMLKGSVLSSKKQQTEIS